MNNPSGSLFLKGRSLLLRSRGPLPRECDLFLGDSQVGWVGPGYSDDIAVSAEFLEREWAVHHGLAPPLQVVVRSAERAVPDLLLVGGSSRGLARSRRGGAYRYFSGMTRDQGPVMTFEERSGGTCLLIRGRIGEGAGIWMEAGFPPSGAPEADLPLLLIGWLSLRIRGWALLAGLASALASAKVVEETLERLAVEAWT